jgi:hypothetical protein
MAVLSTLTTAWAMEDMAGAAGTTAGITATGVITETGDMLQWPMAAARPTVSAGMAALAVTVAAALAVTVVVAADTAAADTAADEAKFTSP